MAISPDIVAGRRPQILETAIPKVLFVPVKEPERIPTELTGQKWLITGVSRENGIGAAIASLAGSRGAEIFTTARPESEEQARAFMDKLAGQDITAHWMPTNLLEAGAGASLIKAAAETMGRIDVVVNNAGKTEDGPSDKITREQYQEALALGVLAPFEIKQSAAKIMVAQDPFGGLVVDISSVARHGNMWQLVYASVKAAGVAQQQSYSDELARRRRIRFNAIEGGIVKGTPMTAGIKDKMIDRLVKYSGGERPTEQREFAEAVVLLASSNRSGNITRAVLQVIGGENYDAYQIEPQQYVTTLEVD